MPTGSCMCGAIRYTYKDDPVFSATCYCADCRKMAGMGCFQVPKQGFSLLAGTPKTWAKISDLDREITNHFCDTCGTILFRTGGAPEVAECVGVRAGTLDDQSLIETFKPQIECFTEKRPSWVKPIEGALQLIGQNAVVQGDGTVKATPPSSSS